MRILFQGDSITDAGRSREKEFFKGNGYASLVTAELTYNHPGEYEFINRGISGNRISDLVARMKCDMINLKPDVMSILIGVNDVWHEVNTGNGVRTELYEELYNILVKELKLALPDLRLIIMEPFVLNGEATEEHWEEFDRETRLRAQKAREVAEKYGLPFVELQKHLDEAAKLVSNGYWLCDGVHPSVAGHALLKEQWLKTFRAMEGL